jgi:hypothetical protein
MRQETIVKTYLKFDELTDKQKAKVLDNLRYINVNYDWYEYTIEEFEAKLKKLGFYDIKTEFSGFWSQGDGACFTAKHKRGTIYKGQYTRYSHANTMSCDESDVLLAVAKRLTNGLYKTLKNEYEYLTSNDAVKDTIEANDYEFDSETLKLA